MKYECNVYLLDQEPAVVNGILDFSYGLIKDFVCIHLSSWTLSYIMR